MFAFSRACLLSLTLCPWVGLHAGPQDVQPPRGPSRHVNERLHERWQGRSREERERLERHLEEFEKLPAETRAKLLERARVLRERERSLEAETPAELRTRMRELGPERGRDLWRQHLREHFRQSGRELRDRLPQGFLHRLEGAPPEVRNQVLERMLSQHERAGALPGEVQRLRHLPMNERMRALRELGHRAERGPHERAPTPR